MGLATRTRKGTGIQPGHNRQQDGHGSRVDHNVPDGPRPERPSGLNRPAKALEQLFVGNRSLVAGHVSPHVSAHYGTDDATGGRVVHSAHRANGFAAVVAQRDRYLIGMRGTRLAGSNLGHRIKNLLCRPAGDPGGPVVAPIS